MVTFLCGLTSTQWKEVHQHEPAGIADYTPEGYKQAGLYEGKKHCWLIQRCGAHTYRYWNYANVFTRPTAEREFEEMCEVAMKALDEAERLRKRADELQQTACETYRAAFFDEG